MSFLSTSLGRLRAVSILEGFSLLALVGIAMPLKYLAGQPAAVHFAGLAHGVLFVLYVGLLVQTAVELRWSVSKVGLGLVASVLPFGAWYAERRLYQPAPQLGPA